MTINECDHVLINLNLKATLTRHNDKLYFLCDICKDKVNAYKLTKHKDKFYSKIRGNK